MYTANTVRYELQPLREQLLAQMAIGMPPNWSCNELSKDTFLSSSWLRTKMEKLNTQPNGSAQKILWYFNRKTRASYDPYQIAADCINMYINNNIPEYKGR